LNDGEKPIIIIKAAIRKTKKKKALFMIIS
jgi:hypothetical protein